MHRDLVAGLFVQYREPVYRFLRRLLRDGAAAEEVTQDTFVRALGAHYDAHGRERAWIFQVARNLARDHLRAEKRRPPTVTLEDAGTGGDPDLSIALDEALAQLGLEDREVFLLKETAGLSYDEIASACGLTADAVRSRLHRTRLALRTSLSPSAGLSKERPWTRTRSSSNRPTARLGPL